MSSALTRPLVTTIKERCRLCYTCVRECPAKAIRISAGQAEVIGDRCVGCGNCVRVCSQNAKKVRNDIPSISQYLFEGEDVVAIVAPSFPAEFPEIDHTQVVGMIRALGFGTVCEVAFGADLVASEYRNLLTERPNERFIGTSCPALVTYVEKYHPDLVRHLAPIVSPMVAMARVIRTLYGDSVRIVFIGPCLAKKREAEDQNLLHEVDAVLTFNELREMFDLRDISPDTVSSMDFDPPHPGMGVLFPISRGMLQAANIQENLITGDVVAADGRADFIEALREFDEGALNARLMEILCCNGCIMGSGMTTREPLFRRRARVSQYAQQLLRQPHRCTDIEREQSLRNIDLGREYTADDKRIAVPGEEGLREILARMGKFKKEDELNCGACGYDSCREHAVAIAKGLAENEMCLPYTIERLKCTVSELAESHEQLAHTKEALMQSERLASMGQLAAGIAHEVNNPLGVVLLYAHMLLDESNPNSEAYDDLRTIVEEADRCKSIVSGLLNFARKNKVAFKRTRLSALIDRCVQVMPKPQNVSISTVHSDSEEYMDLDQDQLTQVLTNLIGNAVAAMPDGGDIIVSTGIRDDMAYFTVADTGVGIEKQNLNKIFEPFYTTKQMGKGTGLGLAVTYGIVKMHRGKIDVTSNADPAEGPTGTTFTVTFPRVRPED